MLSRNRNFAVGRLYCIVKVKCGDLSKMGDVPVENPNLAELESSAWGGRWRLDCVGRRKGVKEEGSLKEVVFKGD